MSRTPPVNFLRHAALMNALGRGMSPSELLFSWWRSRIMSSTYLSRHTFTRESADLTGDAVVTALSLMGPTPSASNSVNIRNHKSIKEGQAPTYLKSRAFPLAGKPF